MKLKHSSIIILQLFAVSLVKQSQQARLLIIARIHSPLFCARGGAVGTRVLFRLGVQ